MISRVTRPSQELTLRDRLSRLTLTEAKKLLGSEAEKRIIAGGAYDINLDEQVVLKEDYLSLKLPDAIVTITISPRSQLALSWNCTCGGQTCVHLGAAISMVLEDKMALGLAAPPAERVPVESLTQEELVRQALEDRGERAKVEKMVLRSADPKVLWADYTVTSALSGKTYRLGLRGWERGESYCSCPDFRRNRLGTCKHILHALAKLRRRFPPEVAREAFVQEELALHLRYGEELELRLLTPASLREDVARWAKPLMGRPITDMSRLLGQIRKIEAAGAEVRIYPDAEEYIQQTLFRERVRARIAEIRSNPKNHPLRRSLLKTALLPYQLDGIAFAVGAGRAVLADDMGLGKTIQGIGMAELLAREAGIRKVLILRSVSDGGREGEGAWIQEPRCFAGAPQTGLTPAHSVHGDAGASSQVFGGDSHHPHR